MTSSLLPHFMAFFSDDDIPGTPGTLATSFVTFGEFFKGGLLVNLLHYCGYSYLACNLCCLMHAVLNLAFAISVMGIAIMHVSLVASNTSTIEVTLFTSGQICFSHYVSYASEVVYVK